MWAVTLLAALVNFAWDQSLFALGRWRGEWVLRKAPRLRDSVHRWRRARLRTTRSPETPVASPTRPMDP